jgi:alkaline phosphatase D
MRRRRFLETTVAWAAPLLPTIACDAVAPEASQYPFDASFFPQSVASGDPKPNSVVLWTRVGGPGSPKTRKLQLEVALDPDFSQRVPLGDGTSLALEAERQWDYCVRVRVEGLTPATDYYYRFVVTATGERYQSRVGRTRTAPANDADVEVRFSVMSCQDYTGLYYLTHRRALLVDVDFIVHLGDYVYETTTDPRFQRDGVTRQMSFGDRDGTITLGSDATQTFEAARSLDNYRDLYRTVRRDPDLQRLHERYPMICVPDDHEFSDDSWGQTATYFAGQRDEKDPERRANADQVWFEYMPVDYEAGKHFRFDRDAAFPGELRVYREFTFGRHVQLVMTDLRRFRPDHLIDEAALPGRIAISSEQFAQMGEAIPEWAVPYVEIETFDDGALRAALLAGWKQGWTSDPDLPTAADLSGLIALWALNALIDAYNEWTTGDALAKLDPKSRPRGVDFASVGKTARYSSFGSRYFVAPEAFALIAKMRFTESGGQSENVMGDEQEAWFTERLKSSNRTWKIWGNSYTLCPRDVDLSSLVLEDPRLARRFSLSADDWNGFPNRRQQLLDELEEVDNLVAVTGDSHCFFATTAGLPVKSRLVEFVCGAVSSATYKVILEGGANGVPATKALAPIAGAVIAQDNPHVAYQNVADNGFGAFKVNGSMLEVTFYQIPHATLRDRNLAPLGRDDPSLESPPNEIDVAKATKLEALFEQTTFRVRSGKARIERPTAKGFETWDEETQAWT